MKAVEEKKKKKEKKSKTLKLLGKGLKFAGKAAPVALPLIASMLLHPNVVEKGPGSRNLMQASRYMGSMVPGSSPLAVGYSGPVSPGVQDVKYRSDGQKLVSCRVRGREYMGDVSWPDGSQPGDILVNAPINMLATEFLGTRLSSFAADFARYRFNGSVEYAPALSATQGGQIGMAMLSDPETVVPDSGPGQGNIGFVRIITDSQGSDVTQVWSPGIAVYPGTCNVEPFYVQPDPDEANQLLVSAGRIVIIQMTPQATGLTAGSWFLNYDVEFFQPTLESFAVISKWTSIQGGMGASSCTNGNPLGEAIPPTLTVDQIGLIALRGNEIVIPAGDWLFYWVLTGASLGFTPATFTGALTASNPNATIANVVAQLDSTSAQIFCMATISAQEPLTLPFQGATGVTSDNITGNVVRIFSDPFSFPTATFGRSKKSLARFNRAVADASLSSLAADREKQVLRELDQIKSLLAGVTGRGSGGVYPSTGLLGQLSNTPF